MKRYLAALIGWILGGMAGPLAATALLVQVVRQACDGRTDCSWGFEFLLVIPILLVCFFVTGPLLVSTLVAWRVDSALRRPAARATLGGAALSIVVLYLAAGSGWMGIGIALAATAVAIPAAVAWSTRSRKKPPEARSD